MATGGAGAQQLANIKLTGYVKTEVSCLFAKNCTDRQPLTIRHYSSFSSSGMRRDSIKAIRMFLEVAIVKPSTEVCIPNCGMMMANVANPLWSAPCWCTYYEDGRKHFNSCFSAPDSRHSPVTRLSV